MVFANQNATTQPSHSPASCAGFGWLCLVALGLAIQQDAYGQQAWEYSPYRIHVWVGMGDSPALSAAIRERVMTTIGRQAQLDADAPWNVLVSAPPEAIASDVALDLERVTAQQISRVAERTLRDDKLLLLNLQASPLAYLVRARELDCHTLIWGPVMQQTVRHPQLLATAAYQTMLQAFAPIARIENGTGRTALVRLRAGGLVLHPHSPAAVGPGEFLQPIMRYNDRYGKPIADRTAEIPWTLLQVTGSDPNNPHNPSLFECQIESAMRAPIRGRTTGRRERYALGVRIKGTFTRLVVESRGSKVGELPIRLPGLEVYARSPGADASQTPGKQEPQRADRQPPLDLLGYTDWRGEIDVPAGSAPLRVLYAKSGGQLLARLPLIPGLAVRQVAQVPNDAVRIQAEGFVRGLQTEIMDLVAQREILAARIRRQIGQGQLAEAAKLLDQFSALRTRSDLQRVLDQHLRRQLPSPYAAVQAQIDKLFSDARVTLGKSLDANLSNQLQQELTRARQKKPTPSPKGPAGKSR